MRKRIVTMLVAAATSVLVFAGNAMAAAAYPISGVGTGFTDQLHNAVDTALPIAGPIIALFVGWRIFKRLSHG
jgi:hypothetical protein